MFRMKSLYRGVMSDWGCAEQGLNLFRGKDSEGCRASPAGPFASNSRGFVYGF